MKTSLKKLQKFAASRHDKRAQKKHQSLAHDELARATQDMNDMRECYDRLLSAAAATANSVYEFSESLREMGDCLLEKTALSDDEESGKVLLMLGKAQFELQKLVDSYRSHIIQTITVPSESLLNELHIVEEMKRQCDEKRETYEELMKKQKEKGKLRNNKGESFTSHQLQEAHDEYDEDANIFVFRMKSLKQGQSRSLLIQASRHHAAQLSFFKKAFRSLEAIEPHVRLVTEQQHIDYQFSALKDDSEVVYDVDDDDDDDGGGESNSNGDSDMENGSRARDKIELSFGFGRSVPLQEVSASKNSMELDSMDLTSSPDTKMDAVRVNLQNPGQNSFPFHGEAREISKSAPLFPAKKFDQAERLTQLQPSASRKFISYVLPTPDETKTPASRKFDNEASQTREATMNLWHSSPLDENKYEKIGANEKLSGPIILDTHTVLKESDKNRKPSPLPPPLSEGYLFKQDDPSVASYAKKVKRQAFSGPLTGKSWTTSNPNLSASGPIASPRYPPPFSGSLLHTPFPRPPSTPKFSSRVTPFVSSPKISELHELPRPPSHLAPKRTADRITHSGPIISKTHELSNARVVTTSAASALPMPPLTLPRSYSIPVGGPKEMALRVPLEGSQSSNIEDVSSRPLTTISSPTP